MAESATEGGAQASHDDVSETAPPPSLRVRIGRRIAGDARILNPRGQTGQSFPYLTPSVYDGPIGALFPLTVTDENLSTAFTRFQIGRRIIDAPIEEAMANDFQLVDDDGKPIEAERAKPAMILYQQHKARLIRFFKLVRLYGYSVMLLGFVDPPAGWTKPPEANVGFNYVQPIPKPAMVELKTTETMPLEVLSASFSFSQSTYVGVDKSRFIHAMNPKLIVEDKEGESVLLSIYDLLIVQVHADWSIGQQLWRNAGGLLGLFAPKRYLTDADKDEALKCVRDLNAKTVTLIPYGWILKEVFKPSGSTAPARTYRIILEQIAAGSGIPVSVLIGSQKGALDTGSEDAQRYDRLLIGLQNNLMTPKIKEFFRAAQKANMLLPGALNPSWNSPSTMTPKQKIEMDVEMKALTELQNRLVTNPGSLGTKELLQILGKAK